MSDPFVHLRVASGYSLRHGASAPRILAERAAEHGMSALALTDRDGVYGAVRFAKACRDVGLRPILGVDLAIRPSVDGADSGSRLVPPASRTPARGGAFLDPGLPRVTLLASGRAGWAALCRLVTATHLAGERSRPIATPDLVAEYVALAADRGGALLVLLGRSSEVGRALDARRPDQARALLMQWRGGGARAGGPLVGGGSHPAPGGARPGRRPGRLSPPKPLPPGPANQGRFR